MTTKAKNKRPIAEDVSNEEMVRRVRDGILGILKDFPKITRSMIGTHVASLGVYYGIAWSDVLDTLVGDGLVIDSIKRRGVHNRLLTVFELSDTGEEYLNG